MFVNVSARTGRGHRQAARVASCCRPRCSNSRRRTTGLAAGVVLESSIEKGRGAVATVLVKRGTLQAGDPIIAGQEFGRVRAHVRRDRQAGRPKPARRCRSQVLGLSDAPNAGDELLVVESERKAREVALYRQGKFRDVRSSRSSGRRSSRTCSSQMGDGEAPTVQLAHQGGRAGQRRGAARRARRSSSTDEVAVKVIASGVGGITESDVTLAAASKARIIGFNVRADARGARRRSRNPASTSATTASFTRRSTTSKPRSTGMLAPEVKEQIVGLAEVREVFRSQQVRHRGGLHRGRRLRAAQQPDPRAARQRRDLRGRARVAAALQGRRQRSARRHRVRHRRAATTTTSRAGDQIECFARVEVARSGLRNVDAARGIPRASVASPSRSSASLERAAAARGARPAARRAHDHATSKCRRDLTHATVYFTLLGARTIPLQRRRSSTQARRLPARPARPRARLRLAPELRFAHDEQLERGARLSALITQAVDATTPRVTSTPTTPTTTRPERASATASAGVGPTRRDVIDGILLLDKPLGPLLERRAAARAAPVRRATRRATPAASTRSRPACCRSASARRPRSAADLLARARPIACTVAARRARPTTGDARGRVDRATPPVPAARRRDVDAALARLRRRAASRSRRCTRRSSATASRSTSWRARGDRGRARAARASRIDALDASSGSRGRRARVRRRLLQGHLRPDAGRGHRRAARHARATSRRCAGSAVEPFERAAMLTLEQLAAGAQAAAGLRRRCCCPPTRRLPDLAAARPGRPPSARLLQGQDSRRRPGSRPRGRRAGLRRGRAVPRASCEVDAGRRGSRRSAAVRALTCLSAAIRILLEMIGPPRVECAARSKGQHVKASRSLERCHCPPSRRRDRRAVPPQRRTTPARRKSRSRCCPRGSTSSASTSPRTSAITPRAAVCSRW